jgi:hypothetical protein
MVRDCKKSFEKNLEVIENLRAVFAESHLIIIENDSKDGTKEFVQSMGGTEKVWVDAFDTGVVTLPKIMASGVNPSFSEYRVNKMANYRNRYLRILKGKVGLDNIDWVIMIDPDVHRISIDGIKHSFGLSERWDVVHANGRMKKGMMGNDYYDVYALAEYGDNSTCTEERMHIHNAQMRSVRPGMPLMPVRSGFNALAIYRSTALEQVQYRCEQNNDARVEVLCEHVSFHDDIRESGFGRQFLNPSMIVRYNTRGQAFFAYLKLLIRSYVFRR